MQQGANMGLSSLNFKDKTMTQVQIQVPRKLEVLNKLAVSGMLWLNGFAHIVIGLALATSVLLFTWLFFIDVRNVSYNLNLVQGFLYALGTLMLLWSISALISAEIRYLMGGRLLVETFVEVALVLFLRKIILLPAHDVMPATGEIAVWIGGALVLCLIYLLMRWADNNTERKGQVRQSDIEAEKPTKTAPAKAALVKKAK
jgi:Phosphate-starvation-inducible E family